MASAQQKANERAKNALLDQGEVNNAFERLHIRHNGRIEELESDVVTVANQVAIHGGRLTHQGDNALALDQRVTGLESLSDEIDWFGSAVITAIVGVISAIAYWLLVFKAGWDPLLAVEGGNSEIISDAARGIMNYHVAVFTLVTMAITFAACVCLLGKRKVETVVVAPTKVVVTEPYPPRRVLAPPPAPALSTAQQRAE